MAITNFIGNYHFLSNFYGCLVEYEGLNYWSSEAAFQAAKTLDPDDKLRIKRASGPNEAKRIGRHVTLRPDWEDVKIPIMRDIVAIKFAKGTTLANQLILTNPHYLVEGNYWGDTFWGVVNGVGENWLGEILMQRRDVLCLSSADAYL